jgi:type VI protein secretion system component Hcp
MALYGVTLSVLRNSVQPRFNADFGGSMKMSLIAAVLLLLVSPVLAQTSLVVDIPGDNTCSTAKGEPGFNALSWSLGGSDTGTSSRVGVVSLQSLSITRNMDACSEKLIKDFVSGTFIPSMTLIQYRNAGTGPYASATVTLTNAYISSWLVGGSASNVPTEQIAFTYGKMCVTTISQSPTGQLQAPQKVCYDAVTRIVS